MARYGKTLREEIKAGDTNYFYRLFRRPVESYGSNSTERLRLLLVYVVLGLSLILLWLVHWITALLLFAAFVVLLVIRSPGGPFATNACAFDAGE